MNDVWTTVIALTFLTIFVRGAGPVALGGRELPEVVMRVIALLAPALLAALVVVGTFTATDGELTLDARAAGLVIAAGILAMHRRALLPAIVLAALTAALVRAVG